MALLKDKIRAMIVTYEKGNPDAFRKKIGVGLPTFGRWYDGTTKRLHKTWGERISEKYPVRFEWLMFDQGEMEEKRIKSFNNSQNENQNWNVDYEQLLIEYHSKLEEKEKAMDKVELIDRDLTTIKDNLQKWRLGQTNSSPNQVTVQSAPPQQSETSTNNGLRNTETKNADQRIKPNITDGKSTHQESINNARYRTRKRMQRGSKEVQRES